MSTATQTGSNIAEYVLLVVALYQVGVGTMKFDELSKHCKDNPRMKATLERAVKTVNTKIPELGPEAKKVWSGTKEVVCSKTFLLQVAALGSVVVGLTLLRKACHDHAEMEQIIANAHSEVKELEFLLDLLHLEFEADFNDFVFETPDD